MRNINEILDNVAQRTAGLTEADLERPWKWGSYEDGLRFAFFRIYETLSQLAAHLRHARATEGLPLTEAQHLLGHYHAAFRDVRALCRGMDDAAAAAQPGPDSWSVTQTYAHIVGGDIGFSVLVRYAWRRWRGEADLEEKIPAAEWEALMSEEVYDEMMARPLSGLLAFHADFHRELLTELVQLPDAALSWPARYWEEEMYPLRFRLQRFDAHIRQHAIQMEKIRLATGRPLTEAQHLLRMVDRARADVENGMMNAPAGWHARARRRAVGEIESYARALRDALPASK